MYRESNLDETFELRGPSDGNQKNDRVAFFKNNKLFMSLILLGVLLLGALIGFFVDHLLTPGNYLLASSLSLSPIQSQYM